MEQQAHSGYVETVRQLYAAFRRGDVSGIVAMLSPDVEWCEPENPFNPAASHRRGTAGFLEWLRIGRESEEIITLEPRSFLSDNDSVAVVGYSKCLAKSTGGRTDGLCSPDHVLGRQDQALPGVLRHVRGSGSLSPLSACWIPCT